MKSSSNSNTSEPIAEFWLSGGGAADRGETGFSSLPGLRQRRPIDGVDAITQQSAAEYSETFISAALHRTTALAGGMSNRLLFSVPPTSVIPRTESVPGDSAFDAEVDNSGTQLVFIVTFQDNQVFSVLGWLTSNL
jgi:hypothetical protein